MIFISITPITCLGRKEEGLLNMRPGLELVKCREHRPVEHIIQTKNHSCDPAVTPWDIKKEAESERPPPFRSSLMGSRYKAASQIETSGCFMGAVDNVPLRNYPVNIRGQ